MSSEQSIREVVGGRIAPWPAAGADYWPPRREAVLRVCAPRLVSGQVGLQINPGKATELLRRALGSHWVYPQTPAGQVDRSRPKKPSRYADVGDSFAYLCGWLRPARDAELRPVGRPVIRAITASAPLKPMRRMDGRGGQRAVWR